MTIQPVRVNQRDFFFAIKPFVFRVWYFCLLSRIIAFLFLLKRQRSSYINIHSKKTWLYVLIMSRTHFRVNPHSIVA